jgi:transcriptional regulator with XRE-family HTH domain
VDEVVGTSFADRLRMVMERAGVNQWLKPNGTAPRGARLHAVAKALGVGLAELLGEIDPADIDHNELLAAYAALDITERKALIVVAKAMARK